MMESSLILEKLQILPKNERAAGLEEYLRNIFSKYFYMDNPQDVPKETSFFDLGLNSLSAVEIKYELEKTLNIALDSTIIFNFPTLNKLLIFLKGKLPDLFPVNRENSGVIHCDEKALAKKMLEKDFSI